jgi:nucleoside-diphosphate-sugar epimerase
MSHIVITGANGFVGQGLVKRLAQGGHTITLIDQQLRRPTCAPRYNSIAGSFGDAAVLDAR